MKNTTRRTDNPDRTISLAETSGLLRSIAAAMIARHGSYTFTDTATGEKVAVSCDLLPSERPGPHIVGDAVAVLGSEEWDLVIAHPPCTYLANSGVRWLYGGKGTTVDPDRWAAMEAAAAFFEAFLYSPNADRVAIENPVMHGHADIRKADQFIQPWQFGHPETKATGLWLRNLPKLTPTDVVAGREPRVHYASPGPDRWKERSRTLPGIAAAMAAQWGSA